MFTYLVLSCIIMTVRAHTDAVKDIEVQAKEKLTACAKGDHTNGTAGNYTYGECNSYIYMGTETNNLTGGFSNTTSHTEIYREVDFHTNPNHYYFVYACLAGVVVIVFIDLFYCTKKDYDTFTPFYLKVSDKKKAMDKHVQANKKAH